MQVKLYNVEFIEYTNRENQYVSNGIPMDLIEAPKGKFIVKEEDLDKLRGYGKGISKAEFIGYLYED